MSAEQPAFDDTRKALLFALNAHDVKMPRPAMTKAMAQGIKKVETKAAERRRKAKERKLMAEALLKGSDYQPPPSKRYNHALEARRAAQKDWLGLPAPAQAGLILKEFSKLNVEHQVVLSGLLIRPAKVCSCRSLCCSGWAKEPRWLRAVDQTLELLKESADLVRIKGKKGLGTQPVLRRMIVEGFYKNELDTWSANQLARMAGVSALTVAAHRAYIIEGLARMETEAWLQVDALFDAAGITGTIIE